MHPFWVPKMNFVIVPSPKHLLHQIMLPETSIVATLHNRGYFFGESSHSIENIGLHGEQAASVFFEKSAPQLPCIVGVEPSRFGSRYGETLDADVIGDTSGYK